jgi:phosphoribosylformylglycinamidine cyclo-ligase
VFKAVLGTRAGVGTAIKYMAKKKTISYRDAGVNIDEADLAVGSIRKMARATFTAGVLTDIGSFGGGFRLQGYRDPVLVSSADGVGTKLKLAFLTGRHSTIGEDLVNHCVNDIAVQGAAPLFFLDYFAIGKLDAKVAAQVISGVARGCKANGCALIGGETAEMPGLYAAGEYDLAGFIVGAVERKQMMTGAGIRKGDVLIGLPSTGLHTNGYSLARKLIFEVAGQRAEGPIVDELLKLHRSYLKPIRALHEAGLLKGAAHITGGGITDNVPRILPKGLGARINVGSWPVLPIFELLRQIGDIEEGDWRRTFNLGIGMVLVISQRRLAEATRILESLREQWYRIGEVVAGRGVKYK